jgi:hypothetical protein
MTALNRLASVSRRSPVLPEGQDRQEQVQRLQVLVGKRLHAGVQVLAVVMPPAIGQENSDHAGVSPLGVWPPYSAVSRRCASTTA